MKRALYMILAAASMIAAVACTPKEDTLRVISYNIRYVTDDGDNSWDIRKPATPAMIHDQMPDVFGVQEALREQLDYVLETCPEYECVGVGREDGVHEGEHMSIFYNTDRVELLDWGTYWLSETPDVPSKGWDAQCFRTATWTKMKMKGSKKEFFYVNTHLDHKGVQARLNGLQLIQDKIAAMNPDNLPMVLTGDLNVGNPKDECLLKLGEVMTDARYVAVDSDDRPSYNGWKGPRSFGDYIFFSGFPECTNFKVITQSYENIPFISDHYPVVADLVF